ncbi:MAG: PorT family protein [Muribaculaceae bacterium]|nr:PorT family protein [Muribaculaceae bacterium]
MTRHTLQPVSGTYPEGKHRSGHRLRSYVILVLAVFAAIGLRAETHYKPHISVGAHAGMAVSRMSFAPEVPQSWKFGPMGGIQIRYAEERLVGVLAELNFVQRGWKELFADNPELRYERSLSYVTLPIMTHISFGSPRAKCFFNLGPEVGFMLSNSISSNFDYKNAVQFLPGTRRVNQMGMDISNKFDYGITAGVGFEYYLTPRNSMTFDVRFYFGLGNIYPSSKSDEFSASRTMSLSACLGYNFRLK